MFLRWYNVAIMLNKTVAIILLVLVCGVGVFYLYRKTTSPTGPVACTMEAKLCPDGSYVGRTGPNCEFTACSEVQTKEETTASLNQRILNGGVFITPLEVVSDSRCPVDVQCIWAGEVTLKIRLEKGGVSKEATLKQLTGNGVVFEGNEVSLTSVTPENNTKKPLNKEDYRFTFKVTQIK